MRPKRRRDGEEIDVGTWLDGDHLHCERCSHHVTFLCRLQWDIDRGGVRALGVCRKCEIIVVQTEKGNKVRSIDLYKRNRVRAFLGLPANPYI